MAQLDLPQMTPLLDGMANNCLTLQEAWLIEACDLQCSMLGVETMLPEELEPALRKLTLLQMPAQGPM